MSSVLLLLWLLALPTPVAATPTNQADIAVAEPDGFEPAPGDSVGKYGPNDAELDLEPVSAGPPEIEAPADDPLPPEEATADPPEAESPPEDPPDTVEPDTVEPDTTAAAAGDPDARCGRIITLAGDVTDHLASLTGVAITCAPTAPGTRGEFLRGTNQIRLNTARDDLSDHELARVLLHELGHAWDVRQPSSMRQEWASMRGLDANDWWCTNPPRPDEQCGAGDLGDAVAHVYGGHPMRTHGALTPDQQQWIRSQIGW